MMKKFSMMTGMGGLVLALTLMGPDRPGDHDLPERAGRLVDSQ
ncbi:hypothetical protein [uncultured Microbacterium sp.]|nr:hypothetical protein [uncultured Microbacterium sp.]